MKEDVARYWDDRYRSRASEAERGPAEFLVAHVPLLPSTGRVLEVAMGTGRNALYLASLGYQVTGVDISPVAVRRCRSQARRRGLRIEAICADLDSYPFPKEAYDVVLNLYYLNRALCPRLVEALRPGGVLVFETFTVGQRQFGWGPQNDDFLLRPGELQELFPGMEVLAYREGVYDEGDRGPKAVASLIARKS